MSAFPVPPGSIILKRNSGHTKRGCKFQTVIYVLDAGQVVEDVTMACDRQIVPPGIVTLITAALAIGVAAVARAKGLVP